MLDSAPPLLDVLWVRLLVFVTTVVGGVALAAGGFTAAGLAFAGLFAAAALPHLRATTLAE